MKNSEVFYKQHLMHIHHAEQAPLFAHLQRIITPHSEEIVHHFYDTLLNNSEAATFLNHDVVEARLKQTMTHWLQNVFVHRDNEQMLELYFNEQLLIGRVHARIDLPICLVCFGMCVIKDDILQLLSRSELERDTLSAAMILTNKILDWSLALINETYQTDLVTNIKESQSFKLHMSAHNLAFDYERLCTSLSEWMRDLLLSIQKKQYQNSHKPSIRRSDFGLWIGHKAHLFLTGQPELDSLLALLDDMDDALRALHIELDEPLVYDGLDKLNEHVSSAIALLSNIAKEMITKDSAKDPLTQLFNSRYLATVMRNEMAYSLQNDMLFGVLSIDIDLFKQVNDSYGHDNGDRILIQLADILTKQVRAGDFAFRLSGGKFLIVLVDINTVMLSKVAEKIREVIEGTVFELVQQRAVFITVSIGTAIHDGHPDFERTLKVANEALSEAKKIGRNKVVSAS